MRKLCAAVLLMSIIAVPCFAGPNPQETRFFRAIAPDYSKTSGGSSPAVPAGGSLIAYRTYAASFYSDVQIVCNVDKLHDANTEVVSWDLAYEREPQRSRAYGSSDSARNIDWSPDGKRLAFTDSFGNLYVADQIDPAKKTAVTRVIARAVQKSDTDPEKIVGIAAPRWSPDGASIAYIRIRSDAQSKVCVIDIKTKKEAVLAADATPGPGYSNDSGLWEQPWSPDGRYLVYATGSGQRHNTLKVQVVGSGSGYAGYSNERAGGLSVVSVDGKEKRELKVGTGGLYPSWSPKGDQIAFTAPVELGLDLSGLCSVSFTTSLIRITDVQGESKVDISNAGQPSTQEAEALNAAILKEARNQLLAENRAKLTADQIQKMSADSTTAAEVIGILTELSSKEPNAGTREEIEKKAKRQLGERIQKIYANGYYDDHYRRFAVMDARPVWSPDGKRIAYTSGPHLMGERLMVKNLENDNCRMLAESGTIRCLSWANSGKAMVVETNRAMNYELKEEPSGNGGTVVTTSTTYSYPEVWLLEPK